MNIRFPVNGPFLFPTFLFHTTLTRGRMLIHIAQTYAETMYTCKLLGVPSLDLRSISTTHLSKSEIITAILPSLYVFSFPFLQPTSA